MNDIRWFAPNLYTTLVVPELRLGGLSIDVEGQGPARLALAMSGTVAEGAWRYAVTRGCPLVVFIWDLPPDRTGAGSHDLVWWLGGQFFHLPRPVGGFVSHRRYYSRLRYIAAHAEQVWVPSEMTGCSVLGRFGLPSRRVPYCYDSERFRPAATERDEPPVLLIVSRMEAHKNQAATIRAAAGSVEAFKCDSSAVAPSVTASSGWRAPCRFAAASINRLLTPTSSRPTTGRGLPSDRVGSRASV